MGRTTSRTKIIDNLNNVAGSDILAGYKPAQREENVGGVSYYSFLDTDGNWYIMRETPAGAITDDDWVRGSSSYAANWANRASLTYVKFNDLF